MSISTVEVRFQVSDIWYLTFFTMEKAAATTLIYIYQITENDIEKRKENT